MPLESNSHFYSLSAMTALLNDEELEALALKCEELIKDRKHIQREALRQELMGSLQKAIDDILNNGFNLMIENPHTPGWIVRFLPNESPNIEIE